MTRRLCLALALAVATSFASGCVFQNISSGELLRDSVVGLNDAARWARLDLAAERVSPEFRARFVGSRRGWGRRLQIADVEMLDLRLHDDGDHATSEVEVSWYALTTMTLHSTVLRQQWEKEGMGFVLTGEEILGGDRALLTPPPARPAPGASDGDGDDAAAAADDDGGPIARAE
jgi:hypothetical protein